MDHESKDSNKVKKSILLYFHDIFYIIAAFLIVFLFLFRIVLVSGPSMQNTLHDGDYLFLIGNILYRNPKVGDVIVASKDSFEDGKPIIKRVIATEGQTVDIDFAQGYVYVDGVKLEEDYTKTLTNLNEGTQFPLTVPEGKIFVLGDNRNNSKDSRHPDIGLIDKREVLGKAVFCFFPGIQKGQKIDFSRIGVIS